MAVPSDEAAYLINNEFIGLASGTSRCGKWFGYQNKDVMFDNVNVALAAHITSYARLQLYQDIIVAESYGIDATYSDTDSIIVLCDKDIGIPQEFQDKYMHPSRLGAFKNETTHGGKQPNNYIHELRTSLAMSLATVSITGLLQAL